MVPNVYQVQMDLNSVVVSPARTSTPPPQLEYGVYKCGDPGRMGGSAQATDCKAKDGQQWPLVLKGENQLK